MSRDHSISRSFRNWTLAGLLCGAGVYGTWAGLAPGADPSETLPAPSKNETNEASPAGSLPQKSGGFGSGVPDVETILERDPVTGDMHMFLIGPDGMKQLLQVFSVRGGRLGQPLTATDADYLQALNSFAAGERYLIGVELKTIPAGLHQRLGIAENSGLIVAELMPGKPAAQAGVQKHDLLLKINGQPVSQPGEVVRKINAAHGQPLTLTLVRDAAPFELQVTPIEATPQDFSTGAALPAPATKLPPGFLPPGVQIVGPGMIVPSPQTPEIQQLHTDLTALQKQVEALCDEVRELQQQLKHK